MGVGIICPRIVIVGCSFIVPYLDVIWCTLLQSLRLYSRFVFRDFATLPEDAAPKPSITTTEAPNSRLRPVVAPNLWSY